MSANIYELQTAISKTAQTSIGIPSTDLIRFLTTSDAVADVTPTVEDDADEIGKGNEFPSQTFLMAWKTSKNLECYLSAEALAIAAAFGLGSGNTGTYNPIDPTTDVNETELPWMTLYEAVRPGSATQIYNRAMLGMVVDKFGITLGKGPGRANAKISMDLMGTGFFQDNPTLTMPPRTNVTLLPASSLTCAINGTDYVSTKNFESLKWDWNNNLQDGYFPGSGFLTAGDPTSGQVQGRMEFGKRQLTSSFVARFANGSTELNSLTAQTVGTAVFGLSGATGFGATITMPQTTFKTTKLANVGGVVTVQVDLSAQFNAAAGTNVTITVQNALGTVGRS